MDEKLRTMNEPKEIKINQTLRDPDAKRTYTRTKPTLDLNVDLIYDLASIHCTVEEIATICHCSVETLEKRFIEVIREGREEGRCTLRRMQWNAAKSGNATMLIWLGKQLLSQRDRFETRNENIEIKLSREELVIEAKKVIAEIEGSSE